MKKIKLSEIEIALLLYLLEQEKVKIFERINYCSGLSKIQIDNLRDNLGVINNLHYNLERKVYSYESTNNKH